MWLTWGCNRVELTQRLRSLAALQRELRGEQRTLGLLTGAECPLGPGEHARGIVRTLGGEVVARRPQQQIIALGAAVLRGERLADARRARLITRLLERRRAIQRGRRPDTLAETRTARKRQRRRENHQKVHAACGRHRLKHLSLAGRMAGAVSMPQLHAARGG